MGTRCGDQILRFPPGQFVALEHSVEEINMLTKESGLAGLTEVILTVVSLKTTTVKEANLVQWTCSVTVQAKYVAWLHCNSRRSSRRNHFHWRHRRELWPNCEMVLNRSGIFGIEADTVKLT